MVQNRCRHLFEVYENIFIIYMHSTKYVPLNELNDKHIIVVYVHYLSRLIDYIKPINTIGTHFISRCPAADVVDHTIAII